MKIYSRLAWMGAGLVPLVPATYFSWAVYSETIAMTGVTSLSIIVAVLFGIGLEITGIVAGHGAVAFWGKNGRFATVSMCVLLIYTIIGIVELWGSIGAIAFLISPMLYVLVGMTQELEYHENGRKEKEADALRWTRAQKEIAAARRPELKLRPLKTKQPPQPKPQPSQPKPQPDGLRGNRKEVYELLKETPDATNTAIAQHLGISRQAVGKHVNSLQKGGYLNGKSN